AVSTEGRAPALAGLVREALEALLPADLGRWTALAEGLRAEWKARKVPMAERRPLLLRALEALYARPSSSSASSSIGSSTPNPSSSGSTAVRPPNPRVPAPGCASAARGPSLEVPL
ncbi:MAG TPA: hypothetical protein VIR81_13130, partial [Myxococcales bacterium]